MKSAHAIIIAGAIIAGAILIKDDFPTKPAHARGSGDYVGVPEAVQHGFYVLDTKSGATRWCNHEKCREWHSAN
jgi:hypothetical protein